MKRLIRTIAILCFIWLTGGCEKDTEPTWIAPKMEIQVVPVSYTHLTLPTIA